MEALNEQEIKQIRELLEKAAAKFPGDDESAERACLMQDSLGYGEVYTFSKDGFSVTDAGKEDMERIKKYATMFTIPKGKDYTGSPRRLFQCVFVYKDTVFSSELDEEMDLSSYKTTMKKLNGVFIRIKKEHRESKVTAA